jgi:dihydroorotase
MSVTPARIGRVPDQGRPIAAGEPAHLTLIDPVAQWTCEPARMATMGRNSPLGGRELSGRVVATFYAGRPTVLAGELQDVASGQEAGEAELAGATA